MPFRCIRSVALCLSAALTVVLPSGCAQRETDISSHPEPAVIRYAYWADTPAYAAVMNTLAEDFNRTNPYGITVVPEERAWNDGAYMQALHQDILSGALPDAAAVRLWGVRPFISDNLLVNVEELVHHWNRKTDINKSVFDRMRQGGGKTDLYIMPWCFYVQLVFYRPSLLKSVNLDPPETYADFLKACRELTQDIDNDGTTDIYGIGIRGARGGQSSWASFLFARGGNLSDLTSPESQAGTQDYLELVEKGYAPPWSSETGVTRLLSDFVEGRTAMIISHNGKAEEIKKKLKDDVAAIAFPKGAESWTAMGDLDNVIFSSSAHAEAAFEWLAYLAVDRGQERWCLETGLLPVSRRVQSLSLMQQDTYVKLAVENLDYAGYIPSRESTLNWITTLWPETMRALFNKEVSISQAMNTLQTGLYGTESTTPGVPENGA